MKILGFDIKREARSSAEDPRVPVSAESFLAFFGVGSANLPAVTVDSALAVPAVFAAVFFLSRTMASIPLHAYSDSKEGPKRVKGKLQTIIHDAPNPSMDSFKMWQYFWQQVFTTGRGLAWIERGPTQVEGIWPLNPSRTVVIRKGPKVVYEYEGQVYDAADVIDVPFALRSNMIDAYSPIFMGAKAIQLALAMGDYASNFFAGGGVPPLAMTGPLPKGAEAIQRAMEDVHRAIDAAKKSDKSIFPMPPGHDIKQVGFDPAKGQMTEARRFVIEEISRIYQIPPVFLQDLSRATFSNAEQQDLHLVKHLVGQWAQALEGEMNLKLFGQFSNTRYVEHNLDGLLRGDFLTRMEGITKAVAGGVLYPNEGRRLLNRPDDGNPLADQLFMQGATLPLGSLPDRNAGTTGGAQ